MKSLGRGPPYARELEKCAVAANNIRFDDIIYPCAPSIYHSLLQHDAIEYYTGKEEEMCYKCEVERKKILREKELNAAFVTFSRASEAQE